MRHVVRLLATVVFVSLLAVGGQAHAYKVGEATAPYKFSTQKGGNPPGQAVADFTVRWKSRNKVVVDGKIADVCPGDKKPAYMYMFGAKNGTRSIGENFMGKDSNGCGNGWQSFAKTFTVDGTLEWVGFRLQEGNYCRDDACTNSFATFYNPYAK